MNQLFCLVLLFLCIVNDVHGFTCQTTSFAFTTVTWNPGEAAGVGVYALEAYFAGAALIRQDSTPISGTFYVFQGSYVFPINYGSALASAPFSSDTTVVYGNISLPLTNGDGYSFIWRRDGYGGDTIIQLAAGLPIAYYDGMVDNVGLEGQVCFGVPASSSPTVTPTASATPSETPSTTPSVSITPSETPSRSPTPSVSQSATPSITPTPSVTPSVTPSITPSVSPSVTPSNSPSSTPSVTPTPSTSPTPSRTPSISASASPSASFIPSTTPSVSSTPSTSSSTSFIPSTIPSVSRTPSVAPSTEEILDTYSTVTMIIAGDVSSFDESEFISDMATILEINPASLEIVSASKKSVTVVFRIYDTSTTDSVDVVNHLQELVDSSDSSLSENGITVLSLSTDTSTAANQGEHSSSGITTGGIIAMAVVFPIAAIMLVGVAVVVYKKKNSRKGVFPATTEMKDIETKKVADEESGQSSENETSERSDNTDESSESSEEESEETSESESESESD